MKRKFYLVISILVAGVFITGFLNNTQPGNKNISLQDKHPEVDWTLGCAECHEETTPEIFEQWSQSRHGDVGFGCYICHGDGTEEFYSKGNDERCSGCHAEQEVSFENSGMESCFDCHNGHTLKFHN
jgi:hypothetical protein